MKITETYQRHRNLIALAYLFPGENFTYFSGAIGKQPGVFSGWDGEKGVKSFLEISGAGRATRITLKNEKVFFELLFDFLARKHILLTREFEDYLKTILRNPTFKDLLAAIVADKGKQNSTNLLEEIFLMSFGLLNVLKFLDRVNSLKGFSKARVSDTLLKMSKMPKGVVPKLTEFGKNASFHRELGPIIKNAEFMSLLSEVAEDYPALLNQKKGLEFVADLVTKL